MASSAMNSRGNVGKFHCAWTIVTAVTGLCAECLDWVTWKGLRVTKTAPFRGILFW